MRQTALLLLAACTPAPSSPPKQAVAAAYAGCAAVGEGPVCFVGETPVRLFLPSKPLAVRGGRVVETTTLEDGVRVAVEVAEGARALEAETKGRIDRLAVASAPDADAVFAGRRAAALEARKGGDLAAAVRMLEEAATDAVYLSDRVKARLLVAWFSVEASDFVAARAALDGVGALAETWPLGEAYRLVHEAYYARDLGVMRDAIRAYDAASVATRRLALPLGFHIAHQRAMVRVRVGDFAAARAGLEALVGVKEPCRRAEVLAALGWVELLDPANPPARAHLEDALRLLEGPCDALPEVVRGDVVVNLALETFEAGRVPETKRLLAQASKLEMDAEANVWRLDLEGRVAFADGRGADGLARYEQLAEAATAAASPELSWRAALGRGRALETLGRGPEALAAYLEAESALFADSLQLPVVEGRLRFLADRGRSARRLVSLAMRMGRPEVAFAAWRRARRRVLLGVAGAARAASLSGEARVRWATAYGRYRRARAALDGAAADDWRHTKAELRATEVARAHQLAKLRVELDDALTVLGGRRVAEDATLRTPSPKETVLAWAADGGGWLAFRLRDGELSARRIEGTPKRPVEWLDGAPRGRVTLLTEGAATRIDLHRAMPGAEVAWSLDLPARRPTPVGPKRALVVADPRGDLASARIEADRVTEVLDAAGWARTERLEDAEARAPTVRARAAGAALLHYAGHGTFEGREGWGSALPLADGGRLSLGDILTLTPAPRWVVLSGCDTGRSVAAKSLEGISLARAFVAAGSAAVVAASRPVRDVEALGLMSDVYAGLTKSGDLVAALAEAQRMARVASPRSDWMAFRAVVP